MRLLEMSAEEYKESLPVLKVTAEDVAAAFATTTGETIAWSRDGPPRQVALFMRLALALRVTFDEAVEIAAEGP